MSRDCWECFTDRLLQDVGMSHKVYAGFSGAQMIFTFVNNDKAACWAGIIKLKNCLQMQVLSAVTESNLGFHKPNILEIVLLIIFTDSTVVFWKSLHKYFISSSVTY